MVHKRIRPIHHLTSLTAALALSACNGGGGAGSGSDTDDGILSAGTSDTDGDADSRTTSGPSSQSAGGTADESSGDDGFNCGEVEVQLDAAPGRVMLVLDKSGSMVAFTWNHDDDETTDEVTRWYSLHAVVDDITSNFDNTIDFGMLLYPSKNAVAAYTEAACVVNDQPEVPVGPSNAQAIMDVLPAADADDEIRGGTPSRRAVEVALDHLRTFDSAIPRAILYVTDGEANCSPDAEDPEELFEEYDDALHDIVEDAWLDEGIPTYVVGIAIRNEILPVQQNGAPNDINPHEKLNELAEQGGVPRDGAVRYYQTDNEIELQEALEGIAAEQISCVVELDPPPEHPGYVEIEIEGDDIPQVEDCATEDGWVFHEPDDEGVYTHIELCGAACDQLVGAGTIDATYGCPPPM
jgi:hypothetical protein